MLDYARIASIEEVKNAMNTPTDFQVIFAVVPWARFQEMAEAWRAHQTREQGVPQRLWNDMCWMASRW